MIDAIAKRVPGVQRLLRRFKQKVRALSANEPYPRGHYYSPLPDLNWVAAHADRLFCSTEDVECSINLRAQEQLKLLEQLTQYLPEFEFPGEPGTGSRYCLNNDMFGRGSAFTLYAMMRLFKPARVIEVGSGYSSAMMLDVDDRHLGSAVAFTFIEPHPGRLQQLLWPQDRRRCSIRGEPVQEVASGHFQTLQAGDILFVDSSHVCKIGSDVNDLLFRVLPLLNPGVLVHFHDIYWPFEYPRSWIENGRAWNEAYALRAFLQYNAHFRILQFNSFLAQRYAAYYRLHLPEMAHDNGSSLWLQRCALPERAERGSTESRPTAGS